MIWQHLTKEDAQMLMTLGSTIQYQRGEKIIKKYADKYIYILMEGLIGIYVKSNKGLEGLHMTLSPGDIFPISMITGVPRATTILGETDVGLIQIEYEKFIEFFRSDVARMEGLAAEIATHYLNLSFQVSGLELQYARDRLIYRLLFLSSRLRFDSENRIVMPRISRTALAQSTNLSKEKVSREMRRLVELDLIEYAPRQIIIKDFEGLRDQLGDHIDLPLPEPMAV